MNRPHTSALDPTRILSRRELASVLADVKRTAPRSADARRNLIVVRLACCCGLRVSEIAGLQLDDVVVDVARPHLRLRRETTKGKKPRMVPLWWDYAEAYLDHVVGSEPEPHEFKVGQSQPSFSYLCRRIDRILNEQDT